MTKAIVGLGNPGRKYEKTRHNMGFMAVEALARESKVEFRKSRHASALTVEATGEERILLVLPQTYMNESGLAVSQIVHYHKIALEDLIVVCDDIHLPFGAVRLRDNGSEGGHNGLRSIFAHLGTKDVMRLRMGVGEPPAPHLQADYVLSEFTKEESPLVGEFIEEAVGCLKLWVKGQAAQAMTQYNKRKKDG